MRTEKSSSSPARMWWRSRSSLADRLGHLGQRHAVGRRDGDARDVLHAQQPLLHGRVRHDRRCRPGPARHRRLALARQHADDAERLVLDADRRAGRIGARRRTADRAPPTRARRPWPRARRRCVGEEQRRTAAATSGSSGSSALVPCTCVFQLPCSDTTCVRVFSPGDEVADARHLPADRLGVVGGERRGRALARRARARSRRRPMTMTMFVPGALDLVLDRRARARADGDHDDHRGDADDHAERGQRGAHRVAAQRAHGDGQACSTKTWSSLLRR